MHKNHGISRYIEEWLATREERTLADQLNALNKLDNEDAATAATQRNLRTVFTCAKGSIPNVQYENLVYLQKVNGNLIVQ